MSDRRGRFAREVLAGIGMEPNDRNKRMTYRRVTALLAWMRAESGTRPCSGAYPTEGARFNPLNTTGEYTGSFPAYNSVGVRNYPTLAEGVANTVATLENGRYAPILASLQTDPERVGDAIARTPWGTGSLVNEVMPGEVGLRRAQDWMLGLG